MTCTACPVGINTAACGKSEDHAGGTGGRSTFWNRMDGWDLRLAVLRVDIVG
jgi:hypothetical protein